MRWCLMASAMLAAFAGLCFVSTASRADAAFVQQVRLLLMVQDGAAAGNAEAPALEKHLALAIAATAKTNGFALDPGSDRDADAALSLVLSGGPPGIAAAMLQSGKLSALRDRLIEAALAFKQGDSATAAKLLHGIKAWSLPPAIGGRVALMQAMVAPDSDARTRRDRLAEAIALMPGTLVEDAALRRSALMAAQAVDLEEFWPPAVRYLKRMGGSLYARSFVTAMNSALTSLAASKTEIDLQSVQQLLLLLPRERQIAAYLDLAQQATAVGRGKFAQFAAARARRLAPEGGAEWQHAALYDTAWAITGSDHEGASATLQQLDAARFAAGDRQLLAALRDVARQIYAAPSVMGGAQSEGTLSVDQQKLAARAATALAKADDLASVVVDP